ncbi:MAG: response regulator [bacterium]
MSHILLVDDDIGLRGTLKTILEKNGYDVTTAEDFISVRKALWNEKFDTIIVDIILPGVSGIEILEFIKKEDHTIPVIMMTGAPNIDTAIEALRLGAYDYITKPVTKHNLPPIIQRAVFQKQLIDDRNRLHQENLEHQRNLEKKIKERTQKIQQLLIHVQKSRGNYMQAERQATLGTFANYMVHELQNPLSAIQNNIHLLKSNIDNKNTKIIKYMNIISRKITSVENSMINVLKFSAKRELNLKNSNINTLLEESLESLEIAQNITLIKDYGDNLPSLAVDKEQIQEVFINLFNNAMEAMPNGGELKTKTRVRDTFLEIIISDTGVGISKKNITTIFTPFFTTKAQGTGLGLSICQFILKNHIGTLHVESVLDHGSSFFVRIPLSVNEKLKKI